MKSLSKLPKYLKLADELRARLLLLPIGAPFLTELALMEEYGVSRGTIRQALNVLVQEGILSRTQGSGSFRSQPADSAYRFTLTQELTDSLRKIGVNSGLRNLSVTLITASPQIAKLLQIPRGTKVRKVTRVRAIDGKPFAFCEGYLRADAVPPFFKRDYDTTLGDLVRNKLQVHIGARHCEFRAVAADEITSEVLSVPLGAPLLRVNILCFGRGDEPLLSDAFYFPAAQALRFEV